MFVVDLAMVGMGVDGELFNLVRADLENAGLAMIEPDGRVIMGHEPLLEIEISHRWALASVRALRWIKSGASLSR